ncbi:DUF480 domain-containing protein [Egicoccus sp. AB-alg6-2]|uniref:DUF480 domain-containing protein n=1 Tax=Egicoccus sp. AB-alg6-2 TaxID=3242692 RepID=UPI00359EC4DC
MQLSPRGQRILGCLVEKALATPDQYPLSRNALRTACNQSTGRDPVVAYEETDIQAGLAELRGLELVKTEYGRSSRVPKAAHRLAEHLDLDVAQQAVLALLLLRGPQTPGELRTRAGRMHTFGSVEAVEAVLRSLAEHRFGTLVEVRPREPGRREARWAHALGDPAAVQVAEAPATTDARTSGRHRPFHDAVLAGDWDAAVAQLAEDVVFRSPAVHHPYEGRAATAAVLRAVATVFEDFRYTDVLDAGDRVGLVFEARVGDRVVQGWDYLHFDDQGRIRDFTVMVRPLSGLRALVEAMQGALAR